MASSSETVSMALFCDFENVALGVRDAKFEKFDIKLVLERLLLKGSIVVKKAYCDWERYKSFKAAMHEANFELIEIPHVRQSGKNSADIRLVVDALDLCYTKSHVNTFVIISGDSDFSPLVSKLRENAKQVIGVGVQRSTSDLLIANCDEFIFYDDLVREQQRATAKGAAARPAQTAAKRAPDEDKPRKDDLDARRTQAIEIAVQTFDALATERGDSGKIWASVLKNAIKRRKPDFNETYYGFRAFGNLLEEAQARGLLEFGRDEKSGAYVYRSAAVPGASEVAGASAMMEASEPAGVKTASADEPKAGRESRRKGRDSRKTAHKTARAAATGQAPVQMTHDDAPDAASEARSDVATAWEAAVAEAPFFEEPHEVATSSETVSAPTAAEPDGAHATPRETRKNRKPAAKKTRKAGPRVAAKRAGTQPVAETPALAQTGDEAAAASSADQPAAKAARKSAARGRRPRKTPAVPDAA